MCVWVQLSKYVSHRMSAMRYIVADFPPKLQPTDNIDWNVIKAYYIIFKYIPIMIQKYDMSFHYIHYKTQDKINRLVGMIHVPRDTL